MSRTPVVFMGVPMAINVRDILRTDAFAVIRASGAEVHLFTPASDVAEFRAEFGSDTVTIHPLRAPNSRLFDLVDGLVQRVYVAILSLRCDTARIMAAETLRRSMPARLVRGALAAMGRIGQDGVLWWLRLLTRWTAPELYAEDFTLDRPDLVVGTRALTMSGPRAHSSARYLDRHLLLSAARRGVPTMVLVSSWDNLTTSGFFAVDVDRITVWNEIMKEQAVAIHGLPPGRVSVTGAPQHDLFARDRGFKDRDSFLRDLGLDPSRHVVVYTTGTEGTIPREPEVVARLVDALHAGLGDDVQVLVRVHQLDKLDRYAALRERPGVVFDHAGRPTVGSYHDRDFDRAALEHLADTLRYADVVVNAASSISIDAAAVGTPVVCVDYDARPDVPYHRSVTRFYDFTHQKPVVASGGVTRARSPEDVVAAVRRYLADPALHAEGRARLVREQCHVLDGGSGRRVGEAVLAEAARSMQGRRA
ncbi:MAG: CDP-glycerol glycerophosphotransferase family protein [Longimicrobiales bacterium]